MIGLSPAEERATRDAPGWAVCSLRSRRGARHARRACKVAQGEKCGTCGNTHTSSRGENTGRGETRAHTIIDNALNTDNRLCTLQGIALMHLKCHKSHIPEGWLRLLVRRIGGAHAGRLGAPAVRGPAVQAP